MLFGGRSVGRFGGIFMVRLFLILTIYDNQFKTFDFARTQSVVCV